MTTTQDSQTIQILNELMTGVVLTPLDAIKLCGCTKLSTRIGELCREGFPIERKMIEVKVRRNRKTRVMSYWLPMLVILLMFTGCADVSPHVSECVTSDSYGFWGGLWHGMILPFAWIGSLFTDDIAIYAYNNNGGWYDFGFILGAGLLTSSSSKARK